MRLRISGFASPRTRALFAGLAAHSILSLEEPLSSAFGIMLGATAHAVGWPIPRGGAQSITNALCGYLASLGGTVQVSTRVENLASVGKYDVALCDVTPRQLLQIAGDRLSASYRTPPAALSLWARRVQG
jgi:phytoene dehydrogenase-like protein